MKCVVLMREMIKKVIIKGFAWSTSEIHAILQYQKNQGMRYLFHVLFLPVCIPLLLATIHYFVLRGIKSQNTIVSYVYLNYASPNLIGAFFSNYAHNISNVTHLLSNILYFEIIILPILILNFYLFPIHSIRFSRKFFSYSCLLTFILGPFVISGLSLYFGRMLNYELGVGFSGINWAFAGLLFFLIISVMFRYLKKNTICGDSLITIHAGIVVMSFVMFFPVCVILSSIKYGGTNVFAHMSGYLFGWLTFPLLAFLLEVHEKKNSSAISPSIVNRVTARMQILSTRISPIWKRKDQSPDQVPFQTLPEEQTDRNNLWKESTDEVTDNQFSEKDPRRERKKWFFLSRLSKRNTPYPTSSSYSDNPDIILGKRFSYRVKPAFLRSFSRKKRTIIKDFSFNIDDEIKKRHRFNRFGKDKYFFRKKQRYASSYLSQYHIESTKRLRFFRRDKKPQSSSLPAHCSNDLSVIKKPGFQIRMLNCRLPSLLSRIHRFLFRIKNMCHIPFHLITDRWGKNKRDKNDTKLMVSCTPEISGAKRKRNRFLNFPCIAYQKIRITLNTLRSRLWEWICKHQRKKQMSVIKRETTFIHSRTDVLPEKTGSTHDISTPFIPKKDILSLLRRLQGKIVDLIVFCGTMASSFFRREKDRITRNRRKKHHNSSTENDNGRIFYESLPSNKNSKDTKYSKEIVRRIGIRCKKAVLFPIVFIKNRIKRQGLR